MPRVIPAQVNANGSVQLLEPANVYCPHRATVTVFDAEPTLRPRSKHAGAFSIGHTDTAERTDELLDQLGFVSQCV